MGTNIETEEFELACLVVNNGTASKVTRIAKQNGITGATIFLGKGTIKSPLLEMLALNEYRKEIVLLIAEKDIAHKALEVLDEELELHKPNHGIAFAFSLSGLCGARDCNFNVEKAGVLKTLCIRQFLQ